jgi:hypothetical protein
MKSGHHHIESEQVLIGTGSPAGLRLIRAEIKRICEEEAAHRGDVAALRAAERRILDLFGDFHEAKVAGGPGTSAPRLPGD